MTKPVDLDAMVNRTHGLGVMDFPGAEEMAADWRECIAELQLLRNDLQYAQDMRKKVGRMETTIARLRRQLDASDLARRGADADVVERDRWREQDRQSIVELQRCLRTLGHGHDALRDEFDRYRLEHDKAGRHVDLEQEGMAGV